jgi:hypothetical protein
VGRDGEKTVGGKIRGKDGKWEETGKDSKWEDGRLE